MGPNKRISPNKPLFGAGSKIQDPRLWGSLARKSWILDSAPNKGSFGLIRLCGPTPGSKISWRDFPTILDLGSWILPRIRAHSGLFVYSGPSFWIQDFLARLPHNLGSWILPRIRAYSGLFVYSGPSFWIQDFLARLPHNLGSWILPPNEKVEKPKPDQKFKKNSCEVVKR